MSPSTANEAMGKAVPELSKLGDFLESDRGPDSPELRAKAEAVVADLNAKGIASATGEEDHGRSAQEYLLGSIRNGLDKVVVAPGEGEEARAAQQASLGFLREGVARVEKKKDIWVGLVRATQIIAPTVAMVGMLFFSMPLLIGVPIIAGTVVASYIHFRSNRRSEALMFAGRETDDKLQKLMRKREEDARRRREEEERRRGAGGHGGGAGGHGGGHGGGGH